MSRTIKTNGVGIFRRPKTQNSRVMEKKAREELEQEGYRVQNRLLCRSNTFGSIPTADDDLRFSTHPKKY